MGKLKNGRLVTRREQPDPDFTQKEILIVGAIHENARITFCFNKTFLLPFNLIIIIRPIFHTMFHTKVF